MKINQDSRPASNARGTSTHGQRPAEVLPGVSLFRLPRMVRRLAVTAVILAAAGAFGGNALAAQAGKAANGAASRESLLKADHAFSEAAAKADRAAAAPLLGPRFSWTNSDGKTWSRTQALADWKTLAATAGDESGFDARVYGMVGLVTGMGKAGGRDVRFGRIWIKGPAGWKAMVYQANPVLSEAAAAPAPAEKGPATCINPCKEVPYEPKTATVHSVVASWQALETANFGHDAEGWARHVSDDFLLIRPNGKVLDKAFRMATIHEQKAKSIVVHVPTAQWVHVWVFGDTAVMIARHHLFNGTPYRATRIWILRGGVWQLALSQQTIIK
jgi:ketosteroid isomerase-like protein